MLRLIAILLLFAASALAEQQVPSNRAEISLSFAPVVERAAPAVVNIYATKAVADRRFGLFDDPFFRAFRDFGMPRSRMENALGSGVILRGDGVVVTNTHVVEGATEIRVALADRREFDADILLADAQTDIAILKLRDAADLPRVDLDDGDDLKVGDLVLAIGNPFGVGQTVTSGIISGLARSGGTERQSGGRGGYFIQTDTAINPGNSGGALVDMAGRLVGVNTMILTRSGGSNGVGFAVPAPLIAAILKQVETGADRVIRPWSGLAVQPVDFTIATALEQDLPRGVLIRDIHGQSSFARSGLDIGDVITQIDGHAVNSAAELEYRLLIAGIGSDTEVGFVRNATERSTSVAIEAAERGNPDDALQITGNSPMAGLTLAPIDPALIEALDLPLSARGVVVIGADNRARRLGFEIGDILTEVNTQTIATTKDAAKAARDTSRNWQIGVIRDGRRLFLRFRA